jgi:hypothetical protein
MSQANRRVPATVLVTSESGRWLVSNVLNESAASFFQEIFEATTDAHWQRVDAVAVADAVASDRWTAVFEAAERREIVAPDLPSPMEPDNLPRSTGRRALASASRPRLGRFLPARVALRLIRH